MAERAQDAGLKNGSYDLVPGKVIVHVLDKEPRAREDAKMEIHKKFMAIHYIISGAERCWVAPLPEPEQVAYDEASDNGFWDCADDYSEGHDP